MAPHKLAFLAAVHANRYNKGPDSTVAFWYDELVEHFSYKMPDFTTIEDRKNWLSDQLDEVAGFVKP